MQWLYTLIILFAILTIYYVYQAYRKKPQFKRLFIGVTVIESIVAIVALIMAILTN